MGSADSHILSALDEIAEKGQLRSLRTASLSGRGTVECDDRHFTDFSSNDYLGLARHPLLIERASEYARALGAGSGASRLVTGTAEAHLAIERKIAAFKRTDAALLFASGWQANASVIPALVAAAPGTAVFTDRLVHASVHHGCGAAGIRQIRFAHNDLQHLESLLQRHGRDAPARLIITESVFSMDGDRADLAALSDLARAYRAMLYVDEAHATGVLGPKGAGLSATLPTAPDIIMGTFSKALGGFGAYVACSSSMKDYLVNACSGFIYSTSLPPAVLGAIDAALDIVPCMDAERSKLISLVDRLRQGLRSLEFDTCRSTTQIVPVVAGSTDAAMSLSQRLAENGMLAVAIRPPTVPAGTSRVRLALRSAHEPEDIDQLLLVLGATR